MNPELRLGAYAAVVVALVALAILSPQAWATPEQSRPAQGPTVPTRTPRPSPWPTAVPLPTEVPVPLPPPTAATGPADTATPAPTSVLTPGIAGSPSPATASLRLTKQPDRQQVWPGLTVRYTLTLSNFGAGPARAVVITDPLPPGLEPGAIIAGAGATWEGRTLRVRVALLPPGSQVGVSYTAAVRPDALPGKILMNGAAASADGGLQARAEAFVVLPPAELPPTGAGSVAPGQDGRARPCGRPATVPNIRPDAARLD